MSPSTTRLLAAMAAPLFAATSAQAHHVMGGELPSTFAEGMISGLAHPVIGLDHLAFIVAAGLVAGVAHLGIWIPIVFVVASIAGVFVHVQGVDLPLVELLIGLSVLAIGTLLTAARGNLGRGVWIALFAIVGIFHGYAYGESIVGAEPTPLWAYLVGLALIQSAIGVGVAALASQRAWTPAALAPRLAGAAVFGVGLTAVMGQIIPG
jgi:urease accessory protein